MSPEMGNIYPKVCLGERKRERERAKSEANPTIPEKDAGGSQPVRPPSSLGKIEPTCGYNDDLPAVLMEL